MIFKFCLTNRDVTKTTLHYLTGYRNMGACLSRVPPYTYNRGIFIFPANILKHMKDVNTSIEHDICDVITHESLHKAFDICNKDLNEEDIIRTFHKFAFGEIEVYNRIEELKGRYPFK